MTAPGPPGGGGRPAAGVPAAAAAPWPKGCHPHADPHGPNTARPAFRRAPSATREPVDRAVRVPCFYEGCSDPTRVGGGTRHVGGHEGDGPVAGYRDPGAGVLPRPERGAAPRTRRGAAGRAHGHGGPAAARPGGADRRPPPGPRGPAPVPHPVRRGVPRRPAARLPEPGGGGGRCARPRPRRAVPGPPRFPGEGARPGGRGGARLRGARAGHAGADRGDGAFGPVQPPARG